MARINLRLLRVLSVGFTLFAVGCGGTSSPGVPTITDITPSSIKAGSVAQDITLTGTNFAPTTTVSIAGIVHPITYQGAEALRLSLSASELSATGTAKIVLSNPAPSGGTATVDLPINASAVAFSSPSIDAYRPADSAPAFYINASSGNDKTDGRSPATAWKTLDRLHDQVLKPGDVVRLARGSVFAQQMLLFDNQSAGSAAAPVVIEAYGTGAPPTISDPRALWDKTKPFTAVGFGPGSHYITLLDLRIKDAGEVVGISLDDASDHIVLAGNEIDGASTGLSIGGEHQKILSNYIHDIGSKGGNSGIGAGLVGKDLEIGWNRFVNCFVKLLDGSTDGGAFEFYNLRSVERYEYVSDDIRIHHNLIDGCYDFMEAYGAVTRMLIAYNVYINSDVEAIEFHFDHTEPYDSQTHLLSYDVRIENNTFVPTQPANPGGWGIIGLLMSSDPKMLNSDPTKSKLILRNNIFVTNYKIWAQNVMGSQFVHDHNIFWFSGKGQIESSGNANKTALEQIIDPQFVDYANRNLSLKATSPAINVGAAASYALDVLQAAVPMGSAPDIGAYEYK